MGRRAPPKRHVPPLAAPGPAFAGAGAPSGRVTAKQPAQVAHDAIGGEPEILIERAAAVDPDGVKAERRGTGDVPAIGRLERDRRRGAAEVLTGEPVDGGRRLEECRRGPLPAPPRTGR